MTSVKDISNDRLHINKYFIEVENEPVPLHIYLNDDVGGKKEKEYIEKKDYKMICDKYSIKNVEQIQKIKMFILYLKINPYITRKVEKKYI